MRTKEEAKKLFEENKGLVAHILQKNFGTILAIHGHMRDDMYQEGCIALYKAAQTFDKSKGFKFSTYGCNAIYFRVLQFKNRYIKKYYDSEKVSYYENENGEGLKVYDLLLTEEDFGAIEVNETLKKLRACSNSKEQKVIEMRMQGFSQTEIAKVIGGSQVNVSRICRRVCSMITKIENGEEITRKGSGRPKTLIDTELVTKVIELLQQGLKQSEIAEQLNIPKGSISKILRKIRESKLKVTA